LVAWACRVVPYSAAVPLGSLVFLVGTPLLLPLCSLVAAPAVVEPLDWAPLARSLP